MNNKEEKNPINIKFKHVMVRESKNSNKIFILLLDTYNPKNDALEFLSLPDNPTTHTWGKYHTVHNRTKAHHVTMDSAEELSLSALLSQDGSDIIYVDTFRNPNRTTLFSKR